MNASDLLSNWVNDNLIPFIIGILSAIIIFVIGRWGTRILIRVLSRSMERARMDLMAIRFFQTTIYVAAMAAVVIASLNALGIHTTSLMTLLATAGVAIGLAVKDSLSNVAAGILMLLSRPYQIDDQVEAGGVGGMVREVRLFSTILVTPDNVKVIIPNSAIMNGSIRNYTAFETRRVDLYVTITYEEHIGHARETLMNLVQSHPLVLPDPAPLVEVLDLKDAGVQVALRAWSRKEDYALCRSEVLEQVKEGFKQAGIQIAYPRQDIHVYGSR
jgi:small conductance mechanosensitive channel